MYRFWVGAIALIIASFSLTGCKLIEKFVGDSSSSDEPGSAVAIWSSFKLGSCADGSQPLTLSVESMGSGQYKATAVCGDGQIIEETFYDGSDSQEKVTASLSTGSGGLAVGAIDSINLGSTKVAVKIASDANNSNYLTLFVYSLETGQTLYSGIVSYNAYALGLSATLTGDVVWMSYSIRNSYSTCNPPLRSFDLNKTNQIQLQDSSSNQLTYEQAVSTLTSLSVPEKIRSLAGLLRSGLGIILRETLIPQANALGIIKGGGGGGIIICTPTTYYDSFRTLVTKRLVLSSDRTGVVETTGDIVVGTYPSNYRFQFRANITDSSGGSPGDTLRLAWVDSNLSPTGYLSDIVSDGTVNTQVAVTEASNSSDFLRPSYFREVFQTKILSWVGQTGVNYTRLNDDGSLGAAGLFLADDSMTPIEPVKVDPSTTAESTWAIFPASINNERVLVARKYDIQKQAWSGSCATGDETLCKIVGSLPASALLTQTEIVVDGSNTVVVYSDSTGEIRGLITGR